MNALQLTISISPKVNCHISRSSKVARPFTIAPSGVSQWFYSYGKCSRLKKLAHRNYHSMKQSCPVISATLSQLFTMKKWCHLVLSLWSHSCPYPMNLGFALFAKGGWFISFCLHSNLGWMRKIRKLPVQTSVNTLSRFLISLYSRCIWKSCLSPALMLGSFSEVHLQSLHSQNIKKYFPQRMNIWNAADLSELDIRQC